MQWTSGTAPSNYTTVDDAPDAPSSYVMSTGAANDLALIAFADTSSISANGQTIKSMHIITKGRSDTVGSSSTVLRVKSGATNADLTAHSFPLTNDSLHTVRDVDPNTSVAWTSSGIDAVEAGYLEQNAVATRMSEIWLMLEWVVTGPGAGADSFVTGFSEAVTNFISVRVPEETP
jgi:hypothetical protein